MVVNKGYHKNLHALTDFMSTTVLGEADDICPHSAVVDLNPKKNKMNTDCNRLTFAELKLTKIVCPS